MVVEWSVWLNLCQVINVKITFLCSDDHHPINEYLKSWMRTNENIHDVELVQKKSQIRGGEILFLISCCEVINSTYRNKYSATLVLHASDLPRGKGWSPHIWELLHGANHLTLSLLEAADKVDSGKIWKKIQIPVLKHMLWDEINHLLFAAEIELINYAVSSFNCGAATEQDSQDVGTCYQKRSPKDSELDVNKTIADQFNLIRVCDPNRFPAYFDYLGCRYKLILEKVRE
jgi:methionyl-tRNA formyltransferase